MKSILIVDDQNDVRERAKELLRSSGLLPHEVYEAATVAASIEIACAHRPDMILLDVVLPDGTGFDVLNRLREKEIDPKVIMMTAFPQFDYALQAINSQVCGFLVKPLNEHEFTKALSVVIQGAEEEQKKRHLAYTVLDVYLKGQQFSMQLDEMRESTGINRLCGSHYLVMVVSAEQSVNLEIQIMDFRKLLKQENIASVNYLQDTATLVAIMRDNQPQRLLPILEKQLQQAFSNFSAGCSYLHADHGIRAVYQNAVFAMQHAQSAMPTHHLICYEDMKIADTLIAKYRKELLARNLAGIEQLMLEFSYKEIPLEEVKNALAVFCDREHLDSAEAFDSCETIKQIQAKLKKILSIETEDAKRKNHAQLLRVTEYIENHWRENINRATIAEALGISYSYIGELFRNELKLSTTEYIQQIKMKHALDLLQNTRLSIAQIAEQIGYQDSGSFIRVFMKHYQITPGEWRLKGKEKPE